jgi:hypothetical protein
MNMITTGGKKTPSTRLANFIIAIGTRASVHFFRVRTNSAFSVHHAWMGAQNSALHITLSFTVHS